MDGNIVTRDFATLVDDRVGEGVFRVERSVYTDAAVFEAEMERIYEKGWVYLCHESQVPEAGSYFACEIGYQPVLVLRQKDGSLKAFINACSHRGALLTATKQGKATTLTCRFHGWSYGCDGHCIRIKAEKEGFPDEDFERSQYDLTGVARERAIAVSCLAVSIPMWSPSRSISQPLPAGSICWSISRRKGLRLFPDRRHTRSAETGRCR